MSPRVWTAEELARVWRVDGHEWDSNAEGEWALIETSSMVIYWVTADGLLCSSARGIPGPVAAALWSAHQGRDSVATLRAGIDAKRETAHRSQARAAGPLRHYFDGQVDVLDEVDIMLRDGRVPT